MVAISLGSALATDRREAPREDVFYRTRAMSQERGPVVIHVVDISAGGCMARTEAEITPGERLRIRLPTVGEVGAQVRWSLGGRIGCQFDRMIELAPYLQLLGALAKSGR
jgi:hypothetical protein